MIKFIITRRLKISYVLIIFIISGCSDKTAEFITTTLITPAIDNTRTSIPFTQTSIPVISTETISPTSTMTSPVQTRVVSTLPGDEVPTEIKLPTTTSIPIPISWIAYAGGSPDSPVGLIKTDATNLLKIITDCLFCESISWSPDGHWLAYDASLEFQEPGQVYISRMDGSEKTQITFGPPSKTDIAWSPDGQNIAYVEQNDIGGSADICIVNKDTGESKKLTYTILAEAAPAWSPDGKYIAYRQAWIESGHTSDAIWSLMLMDKDGKNEKQITDFQIGTGRISWSPDGKSIAFTSQGGCGDIYTIGIDGRGLERLTDFVGCAINPSWSPDGKYIAFEASNIEGASGSWSLVAIPANGGQMMIISRSIYGRPDWKPVPSLEIGGTYQITEAGSNLNIRRNPTVIEPSIAKLMVGDQVTVIDGSVDADGYYWWKLRTNEGTEGWAVEVYGWYQPVSP